MTNTHKEGEGFDSLNDLQKKILTVFFNRQCDPEDGFIGDGETTRCVLYKDLVADVGLEREFLKPFVISLRNMQLIELGTTINYDEQISGSGYFITEKGAKLYLEHYKSL